jgi:2',3'-cyclic-nucleotide 2'-phosphodiesterase (5'-nucleotidase family)
MHIKSLKKSILTSLLLFIGLSACTSTKNMGINQKVKGHFELYSYPAIVEKSTTDERYRQLIVIGLNNFEGAITAKDENQILVGGINGLKSYTDAFKEVYPNKTILLDAGSFLHQQENHEQTIFYYNYLGIDAVNLGQNEFNLNIKGDNYPSYLSRLFKPAKFSILSSNFQSLHTENKENWKFIKSSLIKEINNVKVGILGLHSPDMAREFLSNKLSGIYFNNMSRIIIERSNQLRKEGAQVVILLVYHGIDCTTLESKNLNLPSYKVNFDAQDIRYCDGLENKLIETLSLLPPGKVDLVLTAGNESKVSNYFYKFPVLQNFGKGQFLSWAELYYDTKTKQVNQELTRIHQPIKVCHQFMEKTRDCYIEAQDNTKDLIPAAFQKIILTPQSLPKF